MRRPAVLAIVAIILAVAVASGVALGTLGSQSSQEMSVTSPPDLQESEEPLLIFDIYLAKDGTATWNITAQFPIHDEQDQAAFDQLAEEYLTGTGETYLPYTPFEAAMEESKEAVNRSMALSDAERSTHQTEAYGILSLTFEWEGFAAATDHRVYHGDVFTATDGSWLSILDENEYVRVHAPEGYTVEQASGPVYDRTMWLQGPINLPPGGMTATFVSPVAYGDGTGNGHPIVGNLGLTLPIFLAGISVLTLLLAVVIVLDDRDPRELTADAVASLPIPARWVSTSHSENGSIESDNGGEGHGEEPRPHPMEDPALLSDEERVIGIIELHGGRVKQAEIVSETDWSNAKVSQLLSQLAEEGRVEKLRIGRENLISLPEQTDE